MERAQQEIYSKLSPQQVAGRMEWSGQPVVNDDDGSLFQSLIEAGARGKPHTGRDAALEIASRDADRVQQRAGGAGWSTCGCAVRCEACWPTAVVRRGGAREFLEVRCPPDLYKALGEAADALGPDVAHNGVRGPKAQLVEWDGKDETIERIRAMGGTTQVDRMRRQGEDRDTLTLRNGNKTTYIHLGDQVKLSPGDSKLQKIGRSGPAEHPEDRRAREQGLGEGAKRVMQAAEGAGPESGRNADLRSVGTDAREADRARAKQAAARSERRDRTGAGQTRG